MLQSTEEQRRLYKHVLSQEIHNSFCVRPQKWSGAGNGATGGLESNLYSSGIVSVRLPPVCYCFSSPAYNKTHDRIVFNQQNRRTEVRRIHPLGHGEIVQISETGAPGIQKGPLTSAAHNRDTKGGSWSCVCVCVCVCERTSAWQIYDGIKMRGSTSSWSPWLLYLRDDLFLKLNFMIEWVPHTENFFWRKNRLNVSVSLF